MAPDIRAERAIERYANSVYRMALLRDGDPARAASATAAAFGRIDWGAAVLDDQLEARLIAALPPRRRGLKDRLWQARRTASALPPQFWRLAPAARLALGMRLGRGHTTQSIALALNEPVDTVRRLLCDSIATLAGEDPAAIEQACRHSRELRLDEPGAERVHLLSCDACRAAVPRREGAEQALADALGRSTGAMSLPREQVETILLRLRAAEPAASPSSNPLLLRTASVVLIVLVVLALLVIPRGREETAARPPATARGIVEQAIANYGNPSGGNGVVHQRLTFLVDEPLTSYEAEVWIDPLQPARHRMQLSEDGRVGEWQSGDGARAWRYFTRLDNRYCGPSSIRTTDHISRWSMPAEDQAALRTARWQTGPWALGRQLMEQALAAPALRSLGTVTEGDGAILTLAAEGGPVEGTLLLRIDTGSGALREIRQVTADNGQTRSQTRWKLLNEESIAADAALRAGVFTSYPSRQRPREVDRAGEVIDPACPSAGEENTASVAQVLGTGW
ncbi:MAG TPA: hypothetical protein VEZ12_23700, partial [Herpetosiphonaceae bacterium]|nr:hypothetical protein [Herpetosiphonaceae bacterium]